MRLSIPSVAVLVCTASSAFAQTEGRVSVGGSVTVNAPTDSGVGSTITFGPLVRLNPRRGWGPSGGLNWYLADLDNPAGGSDDFARLRVRPLMVGVAYTVGPDRMLTSFAIVAGPSFNKAFFHGYTPASGESIQAKNSVAVRPGVSVTLSVAPRVGIVGFAGYLINRPDIVYRNRSGQEFSNRWKADSVALSVGVVYSIL